MERGNSYKEIEKAFDDEASKDGMFSKVPNEADREIIKYFHGIVKKDWKVLEIGMGMGNVIEALDCYQYGIDLSKKMLEKSDIIFKYQMNMDYMSFDEKYFDLAFMCFTLQQSPDPARTLKEAERVAKRVIVFDGDKESSIGQAREDGIKKGSWKMCGKAQWFDKKFFNNLGYETDNILPHVLVATKC